MGDPRDPTVEVPISKIHVCRGECLTVYMESGFPGTANVIQVELRSSETGVAELFVDPKRLQAKSFDEWTRSPQQEGGE